MWKKLQLLSVQCLEGPLSLTLSPEGAKTILVLGYSLLIALMQLFISKQHTHIKDFIDLFKGLCIHFDRDLSTRLLLR